MRAAWIVLALPVLVLAPAGCETYRIEYRKRPDFYKRVSGTPLVDEVVLEDGTILRFEDDRPVLPTDQGPEAPPRAAGDRTPGGTPGASEGRPMSVAFTPEQVIANIKRGLRLREYRQLWEQVLAEATREVYAREGATYEDFAVFCDENRSEMMEFFNRVGFGFYNSDVVKESFGATGVRIGLHPSLSGQFTFTELEMIRESGQLRWLMIR